MTTPFSLLVRIASLAAPLLSSGALHAPEPTLVTTTSYGALRGYVAYTVDGRPVRVFKGVPFAAPPVGALRWRLPQPPVAWNGTRDATAYAPACLSHPPRPSNAQNEMSEDCLYLNVFAGPACWAARRCPVVVYLHGGNYNYDSPVMFNDSYLIRSFAAEDVVLVLPSYRLGFAGAINFGAPDLVSANLCLHDILQSLQFVRQEIRAFGGDPEKISLLGHSSGASAAGLLASSPFVPLRFRSIVGLSPQMRFRRSDKYIAQAKRFTRRAGCTRKIVEKSIECLRKIAGPDLLRIQRKMIEDEGYAGEIGGIDMAPPFFPFSSMADVYKNVPAIPVLFGTTKHEMDGPNLQYGTNRNGEFFNAKNPLELDGLVARARKNGLLNGTHTAASESIILSAYLYTQAAARNGGKGYLYMYDMDKHSSHAEDISYIVGIHGFPMDGNEKAIDSFYSRLFVNFTKYSVPSPLWLQVTPDDHSFFSICANENTGRWPEMTQPYEAETIQFWTKLAPLLDKAITFAKETGGRLSYHHTDAKLRAQGFDLTPEELLKLAEDMERENGYSDGGDQGGRGHYRDTDPDTGPDLSDPDLEDGSDMSYPQRPHLSPVVAIAILGCVCFMLVVVIDRVSPRKIKETAVVDERAPLLFVDPLAPFQLPKNFVAM